MAIRFVDVDPDGEKRAAARPARPPRAPPLSPPEPAGLVEGAGAAPKAALPGPTVADPGPKRAARQTPAAPLEADTAKPAEPGASATGDVLLLPGLQLHAKPTPKPRGRKKAFG